MNIFMAEITIVAALKYNFFFDQNNLKSIVHVGLKTPISNVFCLSWLGLLVLIGLWWYSTTLVRQAGHTVIELSHNILALCAVAQTDRE